MPQLALRKTQMSWREITTAIRRGNTPILRQVLDNGTDPNLSNKFGWTLLMAAALAGNTASGRLLIERGARLELGNKFGDTALTLAIQAGHAPFLKMLLNQGAALERPDGDSIDGLVEWAAKYCPISAAQTKHIRAIIEETRATSHPGHPLDGPQSL